MKDKRKALLILSYAAVLAWMTMMFCFSAQPADESSEVSSNFVEAIMSFFGLDASAENNSRISDALTVIVRKGAHFTEFAVLAILLWNAFRRHGLKRAAIAAWGAAVIYAVSDEVHQIFVPGRACRIGDVCIDASGACIGLLTVCLIIKIKSRRRLSGAKQSGKAVQREY